MINNCEDYIMKITKKIALNVTLAFSIISIVNFFLYKYKVDNKNKERK